MCIRNKCGKTRPFLSGRNQASDTYHQFKMEIYFQLSKTLHNTFRVNFNVFTLLALSSSCQYNTTLQLQEPPHRQSNSSHSSNSSHRWSPSAASKYSPPPLRKLKITSFPNLTSCCLLPGHCIVMCCSAFVVLQRTIAAGDLMVDASSPRRQHRKQLKSSEGV